MKQQVVIQIDDGEVWTDYDPDEVDVLTFEWDNMPEYEPDDIRELINDAREIRRSTLAASIRSRLLERLQTTLEAERQYKKINKERRDNALEHARILLREAGELSSQP